METKIYSPINVENRKALDIRAGDTVNVYQRIMEKGKVRLQSFNGIIIARKHGKEAGATFTVRRVSKGIAVEKIFPLYSPMIDKIELVSRARTRRSKLYFFRNVTAKNMRKKLHKVFSIAIATESFEEKKKQMKEEQDKQIREEKEKATKLQAEAKEQEEKKAKEDEDSMAKEEKTKTSVETPNNIPKEGDKPS